LSDKDILIVSSKVKAYMKEKGVKSSGDLGEAVSKKVYDLLDAAVVRARENKRSTVRPYDL